MLSIKVKCKSREYLFRIMSLVTCIHLVSLTMSHVRERGVTCTDHVSQSAHASPLAGLGLVPVVWAEMCPLIGPDGSRDLDSGL